MHQTMKAAFAAAGLCFVLSPAAFSAPRTEYCLVSATTGPEDSTIYYKAECTNGSFTSRQISSLFAPRSRREALQAEFLDQLAAKGFRPLGELPNAKILSTDTNVTPTAQNPLCVSTGPAASIACVPETRFMMSPGGRESADSVLGAAGFTRAGDAGTTAIWRK